MNKILSKLVRRGDEGIAMMSAILIGAVLVAVSASVLAVSTSNLVNSGRDRSGLVALATSESGVAQAIEYLGSDGVGGINCYPTTCPTGAWTPGNPQTVSLSNGRSYQVSITPIQPYAPPTTKVGMYQIDSYGSAGAGPGKRHVVVKVTLSPYQFPIGVFAQTFNDAGAANVHTEMLFSTGCIINRNAIDFPNNNTILDPYYGLPPAVYTSGTITNSNQSSKCGTKTDDIHATSTCSSLGSTSAGYQSFDRDKYGGDLTGTTCATQSTKYSPFSSSLMTDIASFIDVGKRPSGLTSSEYAALKYKAQQQGNYWTPSTIGSYTPPCAASPCSNGRSPYPNAVVYFDMNGGTTLSNEIKNIVGYEQSTCGSRSIVIIVRNADVSLQDMNVTGAMFVPEGTVSINSHSTLEGTLYAKTVDKFNGTADFYLDPCWVSNTPGGLMNARIVNYHEDDRH